MTELQMALTGLGAAAVVGVLAYNKWQEHRHRKLAERLLDVGHSDVLLDEATSGKSGLHAPGAPGADDADGANRASRADSEPAAKPPSFATNERIEPVWNPEADASAAADVPHEQPTGAQNFAEEAAATPVPAPAADIAPEEQAGRTAVDDAIGDRSPPVQQPVTQSIPQPVPQPAAQSATVPTAEPKPAPQSVSEPLHLLSPMIDYVVSFEAIEPTPAFQLVDARLKLEARIRKPQIWVGYNEYTREWEHIAGEGQSEYRRLRIGLQLVDRQGPVSDSELSVFHIAMRDLTDKMMAIADLPARQPMLDAAARLDEFCASVDIQIGINVISQGQVFPGTKLRALAEAAGMVIDAQGRFVRYDDDGNIIFFLLNQEASGFAADTMKTMTTHGLTFLLDVPRVAHGERVFNQMVDLARRFADVLHGVVVDDNRRPLSESALVPIRQQIGRFQSAMAAQHLPAGSALTQRLFS